MIYYKFGDNLSCHVFITGSSWPTEGLSRDICHKTDHAYTCYDCKMIVLYSNIYSLVAYQSKKYFLTVYFCADSYGNL